MRTSTEYIHPIELKRLDPCDQRTFKNPLNDNYFKPIYPETNTFHFSIFSRTSEFPVGPKVARTVQRKQ